MAVWEIGTLEVEMQHRRAQKLRESTFKRESLYLIIIFLYIGFCILCCRRVLGCHALPSCTKEVLGMMWSRPKQVVAEGVGA